MKRRDPHQWVKERGRDEYFIKAKREGYRARSCYKLIEIQGKFNLIRSTSNVLDLGAAPGAWLQVCRKLTRGIVSGIDLLEIESIYNVETLQADIFDDKTKEFVEGKSFDVILSDIAPNCSGKKEHDHITLVNLVRKVLELSATHLVEGGSMCAKIFDGFCVPELIEEWKIFFEDVKRFKPKSSKLDNSEFYLIGLGFKKNK